MSAVDRGRSSTARPSSQSPRRASFPLLCSGRSSSLSPASSHRGVAELLSLSARFPPSSSERRILANHVHCQCLERWESTVCPSALPTGRGKAGHLAGCRSHTDLPPVASASFQTRVVARLTRPWPWRDSQLTVHRSFHCCRTRCERAKANSTHRSRASEPS